MRTNVTTSLALAAILFASTSAVAQDEQLMSDKPSECEVFAALSGDATCATEPSAGTVGIDGETQGLSISNEVAPDSGATTTTTTKKKKTAANTTSGTTDSATGSTTATTSSGPKAAAFQSIQFDFGSAELTFAARSTLDTVASVLQEPYFAKNKFIIEGHTDAVGSAAANKELSDRRAQAVVDYLLERGVGADKLMARGIGEDDPYDPANPTAAVNRRVVVLNLGG